MLPRRTANALALLLATFVTIAAARLGEFIGIVLIWMGYRSNISAPRGDPSQVSIGVSVRS